MAGYYPPPPSFIGGSQPYAPRLGIPVGNVVNQPPPSTQATLAGEVAQSWVPVWSWQDTRRRLVQNPPVVDQPPRVSRTFYGIRSAWETVPTLPVLPPKFVQGGVAVFVQPPYAPTALFAGIRSAWDIYTPLPQQTQPQVQPGVAVVVQPPYNAQSLLAAIRSTWIPTDPQPQAYGKQIVSNQVDKPPVRSLVDTIRRQWEPGPPASQRGALNQVWPVADNPPPSTILQTYNLLVRCWEPPFVWPFSYAKAVQPVVVPPGDQPPVTGPLAQLATVQQWWIPPPWGTQVLPQIPQEGVAPPVTTPAPAGRYRKRRPTRVMIGGKWYEIFEPADIQQVFEQELARAEKTAEARAEKASRNEHGRAVVVNVKPPMVSIAKGDADPALVARIKQQSAEFKAAIAAVYRNASMEAEIRARIRQQFEDDEEAIFLLLH